MLLQTRVGSAGSRRRAAVSESITPHTGDPQRAVRTQSLSAGVRAPVCRVSFSKSHNSCVDRFSLSEHALGAEPRGSCYHVYVFFGSACVPCPDLPSLKNMYNSSKSFTLRSAAAAVSGRSNSDML